MGDARGERRWMRGRTAETLKASRRLREEMTDSEGKLWQALRGEQIRGMRFGRQHAIDRFILDFYCPAHNLAVEVDGAVHDQPDQADYVAARTTCAASVSSASVTKTCSTTSGACWAASRSAPE
jgi:very-short-patch-repair endonuclease